MSSSCKALGKKSNEVLREGTIKVVVPYWWESLPCPAGSLVEGLGQSEGGFVVCLNVDMLSQPSGVQWCETRKSGLNFNGWVNRL